MTFLSRFFDLSELNNTVKRFPLCFAFSVLAFFMAFTQINELIAWDDVWAGRIFLFLITGFFWSCGVKTIQESMGLGNAKYYAMVLSGLVVYAALLLIGSKDNPNMLLMLAHMVVANLILLCVSPFICRGTDNASFWEYNRRFWFGVALAFIASVIFWAGFSGVLASVGYLFNLKIGHEVYLTLWAFAAIMLAPLYALSNIPSQFTYAYTECELRNALTFIIKWILLPLVFIYFIILYTYFAKILILWEIPKGQLATIILGFSGAGILTYLIAWPYREEGQKLFNLFKRSFFPLLILPAVMLGLAVYLRVDQYGFTPQRFYLGLITVYLLLVSGVMAFYKSDMKNIFIIAVALMVITSTPLWNARTVSQNSQRTILEDSLAKYGLIENGQIVVMDDKPEVTYEDRKLISGAYDYLSRSYRYKHLPDKMYGYKNRDDFFDALGFGYVSAYDVRYAKDNIENRRFNYRTKYNRHSSLKKVTGYDYIIGNFSVNDRDRSNKIGTMDDNGLIVKSDIVNNDLVVVFNEDNKIQIDLETVIQKLLKDHPQMENLSDPVLVQGENGTYALQVEISSISGQFEDTMPVINHMNGTLLVRIK